LFAFHCLKYCLKCNTFLITPILWDVFSCYFVRICHIFTHAILWNVYSCYSGISFLMPFCEIFSLGLLWDYVRYFLMPFCTILLEMFSCPSVIFQSLWMFSHAYQLDMFSCPSVIFQSLWMFSHAYQLDIITEGQENISNW
jgi:hypothetical protein